MTTNDIEQIASNAIMIVCGYACTLPPIVSLKLCMYMPVTDI